MRTVGTMGLICVFGLGAGLNGSVVPEVGGTEPELDSRVIRYMAECERRRQDDTPEKIAQQVKEVLGGLRLLYPLQTADWYDGQAKRLYDTRCDPFVPERSASKVVEMEIDVGTQAIAELKAYREYRLGELAFLEEQSVINAAERKDLVESLEREFARTSGEAQLLIGKREATTREVAHVGLHSKTYGLYTDSDPINVLYEVRPPLDDVMLQETLEWLHVTHGWEPTSSFIGNKCSSPHWLYIDHSDHSLSVEEPGTTYGYFEDDFSLQRDGAYCTLGYRTHLRYWRADFPDANHFVEPCIPEECLEQEDANSYALGAAHREYADITWNSAPLCIISALGCAIVFIIDPPLVGHTVESFDDGMYEVYATVSDNLLVPYYYWVYLDNVASPDGSGYQLVACIGVDCRL